MASLKRKLGITVVDIKRIKEHYEVYVDGKFAFSADTMREVYEELREMGM